MIHATVVHSAHLFALSTGRFTDSGSSFRAERRLVLMGIAGADDVALRHHELRGGTGDGGNRNGATTKRRLSAGPGLWLPGVSRDRRGVVGGPRPARWRFSEMDINSINERPAARPTATICNWRPKGDFSWASRSSWPSLPFAGKFVDACAVTGLVAIALQSMVEFSLQMPGERCHVHSGGRDRHPRWQAPVIEMLLPLGKLRDGVVRTVRLDRSRPSSTQALGPCCHPLHLEAAHRLSHALGSRHRQ